MDSHWSRLTEPEGPLDSDWLLLCNKLKFWIFIFVDNSSQDDDENHDGRVGEGRGGEMGGLSLKKPSAFFFFRLGSGREGYCCITGWLPV